MKKKRIQKILIPNRGEIAVRVQRTCRELNIPTVAVFSDPDRHALHVRYADEAYPLPGSSPAETYLNEEAIFRIARMSGADAIHPGYGFLSENASFAGKCAERGILFIGPSPEAIDQMGLKTEARRVMEQAGVPVIPGTESLDSSDRAVHEAERIGYPVLLKAVAGGGGKGMRIVKDPGDLIASFEACCREAGSAFGDARVYMEKYLSGPRHIEFQILGDAHGNVIHLFERECSVQRRHQKIIEETPSPALDDDLRERIGRVAVEAGRACNYTNAGTVEFILDADKNFYFLEMNTRLQVEHPITEMITGIDLVEQQIRLAEGETVPPGPITRRGAAMECRIYAEDPENDFLPSPGEIEKLGNPGGSGVRNDSGVYAGFTIPMEYDPMMSKLIVRGRDREKTIERMLRALEELHVLGVRTNVAYLRRIIQHPEFRSGDYNTLFLEQNRESFTGEKRSDEETIALIAAVILRWMNEEKPGLKKDEAGQSEGSPWKMSGRPGNRME